MASVAGLAPARTSLKGWMRELLCIHGRVEWETGVMEFWSDGSGISANSPSLRHSTNPFCHRLNLRVL